MDSFVIEGGVPLKGKIEAGGSKNCALPVLFATLLAPGKHKVSRVPKLRDMESTLSMIVHLGGEVDQHHSRTFGSDWIVDTTSVRDAEAPYDLVRKMRASVLVLGPLLARFGHARVSLPGGCAIGARPIDLHIMAFEKLGAQVQLASGYVDARLPSGMKKLVGARIVFPFVSVGATENALMAACLAKGRTVIENAAREPEVRDLCQALVTMGAKISGIGTSTLEIDGVTTLKEMNFVIPRDRIESATYLIGAVLTKGDVEVEGADPGDLALLLEMLEKIGAGVEIGPKSIRVFWKGPVSPMDVTTAPFPGFATDLQAQWMVLMTQALGSSVITETIFENRFMHVPELNRMGAKLKIAGNVVKVEGSREELQGAPVMATDLRASASLVLAGLAAKGQTIVKRIYHLDRGYESMEVKLRSLGARVERETSG